VPTIDLSLYVILDRDIEENFTPEDFTRQVVEGGATCLQVRCKNESTRALMEFARRVISGAAARGVRLITHDRVDVALALGAAGVHLGEDDMPIADARRIAGGGFVIGASVREVETARRAKRDGADYLGVGAVYSSPSKPDREPISLDILRAIRIQIGLPVVAIGGIDEVNAAAPLRSGADGVAVISALRQCLDPKKAVLQLRAAVDKAKKR
jgi:thiamine-phosphate pyrophosphorylase